MSTVVNKYWQYIGVQGNIKRDKKTFDIFNDVVVVLGDEVFDKL